MDFNPSCLSSTFPPSHTTTTQYLKRAMSPGARIVMDEPSLELLKGSIVDCTMELIGSRFKVVGNPAASSSCGCGTSFDIKS